MGSKADLQVNNADLLEILGIAKKSEVAGTTYTGDNPLTIGKDGYTFPERTLLKEGLEIINGVDIEYGILYQDIDSSGVPRTLIVNAPDGATFNEIRGTSLGLTTIKNAIFKGGDVPDGAHRYMFSGLGEDSSLNSKLKIFADSLGYTSFYGCGSSTGSLKIFIPSQVHTIKGTRTTPGDNNGAFYGSGSGVTLYCEHESQPEGYESAWNKSYWDSLSRTLTVMWGVTEEQFDAL